MEVELNRSNSAEELVNLVLRLAIERGQRATGREMLRRQLQSVLNDGHDPFQLYLAIERLAETGGRDFNTRQICSWPVLSAGLSMLGSEGYRAKEIYQRRFVEPALLGSYDWWLGRLEDVHGAGRRDEERSARAQLRAMVRG